MIRRDLSYALRFAAPQAITATRALLGAWALFVALDSDLPKAGTILIMGVITDRIDGIVAQKLKVASEFGYLFDLYADYLYYIVTPTVLAYRMSGSPSGGILLLALTLPFLAGAIRYSRNLGMSRTESFEDLGTPGLGTLVYAFYLVALVFLRREGALSAQVMPWLLGLTLPVFSALMVSPLRYPKLGVNPWFLVVVVVGQNLMPYVFTVPFAWMTLGLGTIYVLFSPLMLRNRRSPCPSVRKS